MAAGDTRPDVRLLALGETLVWAGLFYSFPALLPHWERDLGWSKTTLSGAFTLALVASAAAAPFAGRLVDRGRGRGRHHRRGLAIQPPPSTTSPSVNTAACPGATAPTASSKRTRARPPLRGSTSAGAPAWR